MDADHVALSGALAAVVADNVAVSEAHMVVANHVAASGAHALIFVANHMAVLRAHMVVAVIYVAIPGARLVVVANHEAAPVRRARGHGRVMNRLDLCPFANCVAMSGACAVVAANHVDVSRALMVEAAAHLAPTAALLHQRRHGRWPVPGLIESVLKSN